MKKFNSQNRLYQYFIIIAFCVMIISCGGSGTDQFAGQDAEHGRDVSDNNDSDGFAGVDYGGACVDGIDRAYFPHHIEANFWTNTSVALNADGAWLNIFSPMIQT